MTRRARSRRRSVSIRTGGTSYLLAAGFLPGHPVRMSIDGRVITTLTASNLGTITYMIDPSLLGLTAGRHVLQLASMLVTMAKAFNSH